MTGHLAVVRAVLIKDIRLLWPLGLLCATTILAQALPSDTTLAEYLSIVAIFCSGVFVIVLAHLDAPAGLRHEWLTRPIPRTDLILAKALFAVAVILVPATLAPALDAVLQGAAPIEALLSGLASLGRWLTIGLGLLVVASVTASLVEAVGVLVGLFLFYIFIAPPLRQVSGLTETVLYLGSGWVVMGALTVIAVAGGLVVLWLQYGSRRTTAARAAAAGVVGLAGLAMLLMSWDVIFAAQKAASPRDPAARGFALALAPGCFATATVDPLPHGVEATRADGPWTAQQREQAGLGGIGFRTTVAGVGLPDGWRMRVSDAKGVYLDARGARLVGMAPAPYSRQWRLDQDGRLEIEHAWLISHERLDALARQGARLRLDYSLALIAPVRTAEIPVDGRRRRLPGFGVCAAQARSAGAVQVVCFTAGHQPDLMAARRLGAPAGQAVFGGYRDHAPDLLQVSPGRRREMLLPAIDGPARVVLTVYEARAHVSRSVMAPGLPGRRATACPAP